MKKKPLFSLMAALAMPLSLVAFAPAAYAEPVYTGTKYADAEGDNVAVSGYDAVSYFEGNGVPKKGDTKYSVEHDGAVYHFVSQEHADRFQANPSAFKPKYGGHCAWAMSRGSLAPGDPLQYTVLNGKLYLNFSAEVKAMWDKDREGFIVKADKQWAVIPPDAKFGG